MAEQIQVLDAGNSCPPLALVDGEGSARAVVWPGVGANQRSLHLFELPAGARTIEMKHPMEAVYFVIAGTATARDLGDGAEQTATTGSMIFVEPDTPYVISADGGHTRLVGGPCPPDPSLYEGYAHD